MVDHAWFSYRDNPYHNAMLDHGWPYLTMVYFHIKTIFVTMRCPWLIIIYHGWPCLNLQNMVDHAWPSLTMIDHSWLWLSYWDNICHNATLGHGWDNDWFSYWNNLCHNATLANGWPWLTKVQHNFIKHGWPYIRSLRLCESKKIT